MPTTNHIIAGLPAWATNEEAAEAAQALGAVDHQRDEEAPQLDRAAHAAAARFYWASAYAAMERRDFGAMRAIAEQAKKAEENASPNGALIAAITRLAPAAEEKAVTQGRKLPEDLCKQAKERVLAEIKAHAAKRQQQRQRQPMQPRQKLSAAERAAWFAQAEKEMAEADRAAAASVN